MAKARAIERKPRRAGRGALQMKLGVLRKSGSQIVMKSRGTNTIAQDPEAYEQSRFNRLRRGVLSGYTACRGRC